MIWILLHGHQLTPKYSFDAIGNIIADLMRNQTPLLDNHYYGTG